jgi:CubicO group peptidase (beta-lactamase class C family)
MRLRGPLVALACGLVAGFLHSPVPVAAQAAAPVAARAAAPAAAGPTATASKRPAAAAVPAAVAFPTASPESLGLSPKNLARITEMLQGFVDRKRAAGTVTLILRDGKVAYVSALGSADVEKGVPMRPDTIFRIASQSKAITTAAAMMLVDEGKLLLSEPVSKYIPAFRTTTVMVPPAANAAPGSPVSTVATRRQITVRDLMTHTSGVSYGGNAATRPLYLAAGFDDWYFADKTEPIGVWIEKLATLPFDAQPGESYVYGYNTDILGYVVEKASGLPLDQFFKTRIFDPLKMTDTAFFLPLEKRDRFAVNYSTGPDGTFVRAEDRGRFQGAYVEGPRASFSGGAGLLSTASDYARFLQMLLNGGELDGVRLLSPKTVALMTSNHNGTLYQQGNFGFGLGFEITEHVGRSGRPGSVGEFGWGGAYGTKYWVDPEEKLVVVFMTQLMPATGIDMADRIRALLYGSIEVPGARLGSMKLTAASKGK